MLYIQTGPLTPPSPTGQARTLPRPWIAYHGRCLSRGFPAQAAERVVRGVEAWLIHHQRPPD